MNIKGITLVIAVVVFAAFISALVVAAPTATRAPSSMTEAEQPSLSETNIFACFNASNLTLSAKEYEALNIASIAIPDPYCCKKKFISAERSDCLENNMISLKRIKDLLFKTHKEHLKCIDAQPGGETNLWCIEGYYSDLEDEIQGRASCVKEIINRVHTYYIALTQCLETAD